MAKKKKEEKEKEAQEKESKAIIQAKEDYKKIKSEMSSKSKDELIAERFVCENIINKNTYFLNPTRLSITMSFLTIMAKKKKEEKEKEAQEKESKAIIQAKEDYKKIKSEMSSKSKDELIAERFVCENIINKNTYFLNPTRLSITMSFLTIIANIYSFFINLTDTKNELSGTIQIILLGIAVAAAFAINYFDEYNNKRMKKNNYCRLKIQIIDEILKEK